MTEADLLKALAEARTADGEGVTVRELVASLGWSERAVRECLRAGLAQGRYRVSKKQVPDLSGRLQWVPSYVMKE